MRISLWDEKVEEGIYLSQGLEALSLSVGVDVGSNEETDDVEEWHPGVLREELLGERECERGSDPADFHDGHETGADGCANLMEGARASNDGHRGQVHRVLDGGDLRFRLAYPRIPEISICGTPDMHGEHTMRLLKRIWRILAFRLVRPAKSFWRMPTRKWPNGAATNMP